MKKEIEILWKLETKINQCLDIFKKHAEGSKCKVTDLYFSDSKRSYLQPVDFKLSHCLRVRKKQIEQMEECSVTFKKDFFENDIWLYSDETETEIGSFEKMKSIFEMIGLEKLVEIKNTKHKFIISNYEIVIEEVENLGNFIEIEIIDSSNITDVKKAKNEIRDFLEGLNIKIGKEMNAGKPELMLRKLS